MGLNFGAFAGGLAGGIKTGLELADKAKAREQKERQLKVAEAQQTIENKQKENKLKLEAEKIHGEQVKEYAKTKTEAEKILYDNDIDLKSRFSQYNRLAETNNLTDRILSMTSKNGNEFGIEYKVDNQEIVQSAIADIEANNGLGKFKMDSTGQLYSRPSEAAPFTPIEGVFGISSAEYGKKKEDIPTMSELQIRAYQEAVENGYKGSPVTWVQEQKEKGKPATTKGTGRSTEVSKGGQWVTSDDNNKAIYVSNAEIEENRGKYSPVDKKTQKKNTSKILFLSQQYGNNMLSGKPTKEYTLEQLSEMNSVARGSLSSADSKKLSDDEEYFSVSNEITEFAKNVNNKFEKGELNIGLMDTAITQLSSYAPKIGELYGLSKQEIIDTLNLTGEGSDIVAQMVKMLSGLAATDKEFVRTQMNYLGTAYQDPKVYAERIKATAKRIEARVKRKRNKWIKKGINDISKTNKTASNPLGSMSVDDFNKTMGVN